MQATNFEELYNFRENVERGVQALLDSTVNIRATISEDSRAIGDLAVRCSFEPGAAFESDRIIVQGQKEYPAYDGTLTFEIYTERRLSQDEGAVVNADVDEIYTVHARLEARVRTFMMAARCPAINQAMKYYTLLEAPRALSSNFQSLAASDGIYDITALPYRFAIRIDAGAWPANSR